MQEQRTPPTGPVLPDEVREELADIARELPDIGVLVDLLIEMEDEAAQ